MRQPLGPAIITERQQKMLMHGRMMNLPEAAVFPDAAAKAEPGDIFWVKEPAWEVESRQHGPSCIHEVVPGPIVGVTPWPAHIKPYLHDLKMKRVPAKRVARGESRAFLEILGPSNQPPGWLCRIHMQNIDAALKAEAA